MATIIPDLAAVALFIYIYLSIYSLDTSSPTAHVHNGKTKRFAPSSPKAPVKKKTRKEKNFSSHNWHWYIRLYTCNLLFDEISNPEYEYFW